MQDLANRYKDLHSPRFFNNSLNIPPANAAISPHGLRWPGVTVVARLQVAPMPTAATE